MTPPRCANCATRHGPIDACLIGVLAGILRDRGVEVTADDLAGLDVDAFWDEVGGPAVDRLAAYLGKPSYTEDAAI